MSSACKSGRAIFIAFMILPPVAPLDKTMTCGAAGVGAANAKEAWRQATKIKTPIEILLANEGIDIT